MKAQTKLQLKKMFSLVGMLALFFLSTSSTQAESHDPYRGLVDQNMFTRASLNPGCDNQFSGLLKKVNIVQGESRSKAQGDAYGGFIISGPIGKDVALGGRGAVVGRGNMVVTAAHTIIDLEHGGIHPDMQSPSGVVKFLPSKALYLGGIEIDLERSKFGCRSSYKDPLPENVLNDPVKLQECDRAILVLKEDSVKGRAYNGKGVKILSFADSYNKEAFRYMMGKGQVSFVTANPHKAVELFTESNCATPVRVPDLQRSILLSEHGCDSASGDSGSVFRAPCTADSRYTCVVGIHFGDAVNGPRQSAVREGLGSRAQPIQTPANGMLIFGHEFYQEFGEVYDREEARSKRNQTMI